MYFTNRFFSFALALVASPFVLGQTGPTGNLTGLEGTWSSGSQHVVTGNGFANPPQTSFVYPNTTGISYSFTNDGYYEIARYRFVGNGSEPNCIIGVMNWCHGTYEVLANGSLIMIPFGDGYQQIQDPCAAQSNFIQNYNDTELYIMWQIFLDPTYGYKLHLYQFDGSPLAPMFQASTSPNMLPTRALRNVTVPVQTSTSNGFTTQNDLVVNTNGASGLWSTALGVTGVAVMAGMLSVLM